MHIIKVKTVKEGTKKFKKKFKKSIDILRMAEYNKSIEAKHQIKSHWWLRVKKNLKSCNISDSNCI